MNHHITVSFGAEREYGFRFGDGETAGLSQERAREWIEEECARLEPDLTSPVGKTLLADKLLTIVRAHGEQPFASGTPWAREFARCAGKAVGRPNIRIDVPAGTVAF
jgi:hypothetical protein